jgi:hypothetical protein
MTVQYYPFASVRPVSPASIAASAMTNTETGELNKILSTEKLSLKTKDAISFYLKSRQEI